MHHKLKRNDAIKTSNLQKMSIGYLQNQSKIYHLKSSGIIDYIIDPGFGFGKTLEHNYTLLRELDSFGMMEAPLMVGISRKSMIYKQLDIEVGDTLNGTTALHMAALMKGVNILRVHDVKEAVETVKLFTKMNA